MRFNHEGFWEINVDGSNLHKVELHLPPNVTEFPVNLVLGYKSGQWTPDGNYSVFVGTGAGGTQIWASREKGALFHKSAGIAVRLTNLPLQIWLPTFSPDGKKLFVLGLQYRVEPMKLDRVSGQLRPYRTDLSAGNLVFSKDKQWIAYVTYPQGELWRSRMDGSERLKLIPAPPIFVADPHWSPDGTQIAFKGFHVDDFKAKLYVVSAYGGTPTRLIEGLVEEPFLFDWSPDGTRIVYAPSSPDSRHEDRKIYLYDLASKKTSIIKGSHEMTDPSWSPDGSFLLENLFEGSLKLFNLRTQKWHDLCNGVFPYPALSRDGRDVYFLQMPNKEICRLHLATRKIEKLYDMKGIQTQGIESDAWLGLTPEDEPLILRDASTAEIYSYDWIAP